MVRIFLVFLLPTLGACILGHDETTKFPPGLQPLETNTAELPATPDTVITVTGENDQWTWGHGRALISAPAAAVWRALKDPNVVASRRQTDKYSFTLTSDPTYEFSFQLHYEVDKILTVTWDEDWRYGTIRGTPDDPQLAIIRNQKTFGSSFIDLIEGSITVLPHGASETEVQFIEHVNALQADQGNIRTTIQDQVTAIVAVSHGQPLPPL